MKTQVDVILVNENDEAYGTMEKMQAHREGVLHRAFSVFIFDRAGRMLLQQRAAGKYHGGLLWTNACCSHPYPGEDTAAAAGRRLEEELGFSTPLLPLFTFTYRADVENGLVEHEFDHVFAGIYEGGLRPNPDEVADYAYEEMESLDEDLRSAPERYTAWFRLAWPRIRSWWQAQRGHGS